jgi:hypothetical protein
MTPELKTARQQVKGELAAGFMHDLTLANRIAVVKNTFLGDERDRLVAALVAKEPAVAAFVEKLSDEAAVRRILRPTPRLAKGHSLPDRPVYWAIQLHDADTGKVTTTRCAWNRTRDPRKASDDAFGIPPTGNMTFFNLGTTLAGARKMLRTLPG